MNMNQKLEEIKVFWGNCFEHGVNHMEKGETVKSLELMHCLRINSGSAFFMQLPF
ncbi:hypothetical protein M2145_001355 [Lachnospiraceae bacterium PF1-21]|uniref:Uncharacterized protein n=1 Tax=Hespellia stercorisuis DSM 15480 TaxID=1121950 RepID=A0A1M6T5R2_9FIRM|nr:hypothetical protein [Hespellia stercorisuis]SHK52280.1 hypothetical protein SAMN02745243_03138 [Hespellia stercorisuis DSM 15480]